MSIPRQPSCDDPVEPELMPVVEAKRRMALMMPPIDDTEVLPTVEAAGRVLANAVTSPMNVPAATNSAMDGYAINSADIPEHGEAQLNVVGEAYAGVTHGDVVPSGSAVRVFTGAVLPKGTDTVVIQEHVEVVATNASQAKASEHGAHGDLGAVRIDHQVQAGRNVRHAGEDLNIGDTVLEAGRQLSAADIGLIASVGIVTVTVTRRLKVAFFSTGDEVQPLDKAICEGLPQGMVYDSNRHTLRALLNALGVEALDFGIVRDTFDDTIRVLKEASEQADVLVTSGGVSAGEADYVTKAFHELGDVSFWKIAMRPGRPLASGRIGDARFFGLPGNPVAVMVCFLAFVQPALKLRMGMKAVEPFAVPATSISAIKKSPGRYEYQRGIATLNKITGVLEVKLTGKQGAGRLSSMSIANCLIVMDDTVNAVNAGDTVTIWPFAGLLP